jgi:DHA2 family metal-tetracycline-proton antiporter-like MFS transporter
MTDYIVQDSRRQLWIVISVAFAAFMAALDTYIVNVALPTIASDFNASPTDAALITLAYLLIITSTLLIFGKIGERTGFKIVFVAGFALFAVGSFLSGLAPTLLLLAGARCIQGLGAAMLYAVGMAMIIRYIPSSKRGWAFGITSTGAGMGVIIGAPMGGFITQYLDWHWIFWFNVPVGIIAAIVALKVMPDDRVSHVKGTRLPPFDIAGAVMSFIALALLVGAINRGQQLGWAHWGIWGSFAVSAVLFIAFVLWEKRCRDPLLNMSLFKSASFAFGSFAALAAWSMYSGGNFLFPFYLTMIHGLSSSLIGSIFLVSSVVYIATSLYMGRLSDRIGRRLLCCAGMVASAAALIFLGFTMGLPSLIPMMVYLAWIGLSMGTFVSPNNSLMLSSIPADNQGEASAASRAMQNLGMVLGVAIYETVFSAFIPAADFSTAQAVVDVPKELLLTGFSAACFVGAAMCVLSLVLSWLAREDSAAATGKSPESIAI